MEKVDYKKKYKDLYVPKRKPVVIDVPEMSFLMVNGRGNPNTSESYKQALEILYGLSFTIKMSKMSGNQPEGYFDYVVPPLEGLWYTEDSEKPFDNIYLNDKDCFCWTSMIRQPEFVTTCVYEWAKGELLKKKPNLDFTAVRFETYNEGTCCQAMHIGPYDNEPDTIRLMQQFIDKEGYVEDFSHGRFHHEIYLGDPRKTKPENLKTVIRHPIKKR